MIICCSYNYVHLKYIGSAYIYKTQGVNYDNRDISISIV